jgi:hypothetical protein
LGVAFDGYLVCHGARGAKNCRLHPKQFGCFFLERIDGGIFSKHIISNHSLLHGFLHSWRGFGHGIGPEIYYPILHNRKLAIGQLSLL